MESGEELADCENGEVPFRALDLLDRPIRPGSSLREAVGDVLLEPQGNFPETPVSTGGGFETLDDFELVDHEGSAQLGNVETSQMMMNLLLMWARLMVAQDMMNACWEVLIGTSWSLRNFHSIVSSFRVCSTLGSKVYCRRFLVKLEILVCHLVLDWLNLASYCELKRMCWHPEVLTTSFLLTKTAGSDL